MTSTAVVGAPARNFGPTLSSYVASSSNPPSSHSGSALSSLVNSPTSSFRPSLAGSHQPQSPDSPYFSDPFGDTNVGLGLSLKLGQAPPVHQEPAKSRIHRYSLTSQHSTTSRRPSQGDLVSSFHQPHHRTLSNNSTFSSVSSFTSNLSSPSLERHGSHSSLSSEASSPLSLRPVGSTWLDHQDSNKDMFSWSDTEDLLSNADDPLESPITSRFNRLAFE